MCPVARRRARFAFCCAHFTLYYAPFRLLRLLALCYAPYRVIYEKLSA